MQVLKAERSLFRIIVRLTKVTEDAARRAATDMVKNFDDADPKYEFWGHGPTVGIANIEFTTMFPWKKGTPSGEASEKLARMVAGVVWHSMGDVSAEPIRVKCAPFAEFMSNTPTYVLDENVYWCDFYDEELASLMADHGMGVKDVD